MLTLLLALATAVTLAVGGALRFDVLSGVVVGVVVGIAILFVVLRKTRRKVEAAMKDVENHLKGQRTEKAVQALEALRPLGKWQPLLTSSIDAQIGMIRYAHARDFDGARPFLERAHIRIWQAWAMLGAYHFIKKNYDQMKTVFEKATKKNPKEGMLWGTYAYCEWKRGNRDHAIAILARGQMATPKDERLKNQLLALQNGKKLKMQTYGAEWMALHLEKDPNAGLANAKPRYMPPPSAIRMGGRKRGRYIPA